MPAAHALIDALEDIEKSVSELTSDQLWLKPGGAASIGFHLKHVPGSLERLLTYARGESLTRRQLNAIREEEEPGTPPARLESLLTHLREAVEETLDVYRKTDPSSLDEPRAVGRAGLPSTVQGVLFHAADHTRRHAGQVVATSKIVRGLDLREPDERVEPG